MNTEAVFQPDKVRLVREARGLSQSSLANLAGITQGTVSKLESGVLLPNHEQLSSIAAVLQVRPSYFYRHDRIVGDGPGELFHRKRVTGAKQLNKINAQMNMLMFVVDDLLRSVEPRETNIPLVNEYKPDDLSEIVYRLRLQWYVPSGPIASVSELLFYAGVLLIPFNFDGAPIDAVGKFRKNCAPVIFFNPRVPDDRLRFTLMHEIGHYCLHHGRSLEALDDRIEQEADDFASHFLLPREEITRELRGISVAKLGSLKLKWKCSMQAILMAAQSSGTISNKRATELWRELSRHGYRTREPEFYDVHCENPNRAFEELVELHLNDLDYSISELETMTDLKAAALLPVINRRPETVVDFPVNR